MMYLGKDAVGLAISNSLDNLSGGNIKALISHGTEYIITDIYPDTSTACKIDFEKLEGNKQWAHLFGGTNASYRLLCQISGESQLQGGYLVSAVAISNVAVNKRVRLVLSNAFYTEDTWQYDTSSESPLLLFAGYWQGNMENNFAKIKFYNLKFYNPATSVIKYNFVPWLDENNVACIKETVSNQLYYNSGTGTFGYIDWNDVVHDT